MNFFNRHLVPVILAVIGIVGLILMGHLFINEQVGINPMEFVLKACGKIFYLGIAWLLTHVIIKYFFTPVYEFTHFDYDGSPTKGYSKFKEAWNKENYYDPRLGLAIAVHIGVFASVCLLLALAF
jgi:hypothetical protein